MSNIQLSLIIIMAITVVIIRPLLTGKTPIEVSVKPLMQRQPEL